MGTHLSRVCEKETLGIKGCCYVDPEEFEGKGEEGKHDPLQNQRFSLCAAQLKKDQHTLKASLRERATQDVSCLGLESGYKTCEVLAKLLPTSGFFSVVLQDCKISIFLQQKTPRTLENDLGSSI